MKMIIQNKHYFKTFLLTSKSKCNFRVTNPALNCDLLCMNKLQIILIFLQSCDRSILTLEVRSLQSTFQLACQQPSLVWCCEGRLVKVSLTIDAVSVNSRSTRLLEFSCIIISLGRQVKISLLNTRNV